MRINGEPTNVQIVIGSFKTINPSKTATTGLINAYVKTILAGNSLRAFIKEVNAITEPKIIKYAQASQLVKLGDIFGSDKTKEAIKRTTPPNIC